MNKFAGSIKCNCLCPSIENTVILVQQVFSVESLHNVLKHVRAQQKTNQVSKRKKLKMLTVHVAQKITVSSAQKCLNEFTIYVLLLFISSLPQTTTLIGFMIGVCERGCLHPYHQKHDILHTSRIVVLSTLTPRSNERDHSLCIVHACKWRSMLHFYHLVQLFLHKIIRINKLSPEIGFQKNLCVYDNGPKYLIDD